MSLFGEFLEALGEYQDYKKSMSRVCFNGDFDAAARRNDELKELEQKCEETFEKYLADTLNRNLRIR